MRNITRMLRASLGCAAILAVACSEGSTGPGSGGVSIYPAPPGPQWNGQATAVTVGERANCLLATDGTPWCWGSTRGFGLRVDIGLRGVPQGYDANAIIDSVCFANKAVDSIAGWPCNVFHPMRVSTRTFVALHHAPWDSPLCGLDPAGAAYCWDQGSHLDIQADSSVNGFAYCGGTLCLFAPQRVHASQPLRQYEGDMQGQCAVAVAGTVLCMGSNFKNLLGSRPTNFRSDTLVPVAGAPLSVAVAVAPSSESACAIATTGKVFCWGDNLWGQAGINVFGGQIATPTQVVSALSFTALAVSLTSACALSTAGQAYCWGDGRQGQIGWNATGWSTTPYPVSGGRTYTAITAGAGHFCALQSSGAVWCWGDNQLGQLGVPPTPGATCEGGLCSSVPVQVQGGHTFKQISAGIGMTCGVTTSSEVYCWGWTQYGRLGPAQIGEYGYIATPVKITP